MGTTISNSVLIVATLTLAAAGPSGAQKNLETQHRSLGEAGAASELSAAGEAVAGGAPRPLLVQAAAFTDDGVLPASAFFSFSMGRLSGTASNYGCSMAPVYLPNGATVTSLNAVVSDNGIVGDVSVQLRKIDSFSGVAIEMARVTSVGSPGLVSIFDKSSGIHLRQERRGSGGPATR